MSLSQNLFGGTAERQKIFQFSADNYWRMYELQTYGIRSSNESSNATRSEVMFYFIQQVLLNSLPLAATKQGPQLLLTFYCSELKVAKYVRKFSTYSYSYQRFGGTRSVRVQSPTNVKMKAADL